MEGKRRGGGEGEGMGFWSWRQRTEEGMSTQPAGRSVVRVIVSALSIRCVLVPSDDQV